MGLGVVAGFLELEDGLSITVELVTVTSGFMRFRLGLSDFLYCC